MWTAANSETDISTTTFQVGIPDELSFGDAANPSSAGYDIHIEGSVAGTAGKIGIGTQSPIGKLSVMAEQYSVGSASQSTTTITGVGTTWTSAMVGSTMVFYNGVRANITAFVSTTQLTASQSQTVASQGYTISWNSLHATTDGRIGLGITVPLAQVHQSSSSTSPTVPELIVEKTGAHATPSNNVAQIWTRTAQSGAGDVGSINFQAKDTGVDPAHYNVGSITANKLADAGGTLSLSVGYSATQQDNIIVMSSRETGATDGYTTISGGLDINGLTLLLLPPQSILVTMVWL